MDESQSSYESYESLDEWREWIDRHNGKFRWPTLFSLTTTLQLGEYTDCTIQCSDGEHRSHKALLASQSPVMEAMFRRANDGDKDTIHAEMFSTSTMKEVVRFATAGDIYDIWNKCEWLLEASDYFLMNHMKSMIANAMVQRLDVNNHKALSAIFRKYNCTEQLWEINIINKLDTKTDRQSNCEQSVKFSENKDRKLRKNGKRKSKGKERWRRL